MVECVANVSEGRDMDVLDRMSAAISNVSGATLLHRDIGWDAHRSVFTFAGSGESVAQAALALADCCLKWIDMTKHHGSHPRMGALDVCPIVPLSPDAHKEADAAVAAIAAGLALKEVGGWLYAQSAMHAPFVDLTSVRKGEYEGLMQRSVPFDFGCYQQRFGATALGKRSFLLAYNINVRGRHVPWVEHVAQRVRQRHPDGLPGVRAIGWDCPTFDCTQVSCNIFDLDRCTPKLLFDRVTLEIRTLGGEVFGSELIGLAPMYAFRDFETIEEAVRYLGLASLESFDPDVRILERVLPH